MLEKIISLTVKLMRRKNLFILSLLAFFFIFLPVARAGESSKTVIFFHSATCPACVIAEKYLLAEAAAGKLSLFEFENSSFPNLRAEFDTAFGVALASKNSIPIVFVGQQYLCGAAIKSELAPILTALKPEAYAYPMLFLTNSKNYTATLLEQANIASKNKFQKQALAYLMLLSLALLALPLCSRKRKS